MILRLTALGLAVIATYWSVLAVIVMVVSHHPAAIGIFSPAILMTLGYWARTVLNLPRAARVGVWWLSIVVQGGWGLFGLYELFHWGLDGSLILLIFWWWAATALSAWCLILESPESPEWVAIWSESE